MIQIQRVYHEASPRDGLRILVDRLWPCGLKKEAAHVQEWRKDLAPREALRRWFKHDPVKWSEFRRRYRQELAKDATMEGLRQLAASANASGSHWSTGLPMKSLTKQSC